MKRIKRIMVSNGDGEPIQIGHILQAEDGTIKIKIDSIDRNLSPISGRATY